MDKTLDRCVLTEWYYEVNNTGWRYSLEDKDTSMTHALKRDSRRNLLALDYVVSYVSEQNLWGCRLDEPEVINIAGPGCTPEMMRYCGSKDWEDMDHFVSDWSLWVSQTSSNPGLST